MTVCLPDWILALLIIALGGDWIARRVNGWILRSSSGPPEAESGDESGSSKK